jgi:hypothetical protein
MSTNSNKTNKGEKSYIEQKLNKIPLEKLSKESKFSKRKQKKITAKDFLLGFFLMGNNPGDKSYRNWAIKIGLLIKDKVSKQALWKKMQEEQIVFLKKVLTVIIKGFIGQKKATKLKMFNDVIIEDSTHIKLNDKLYKEYPGNENQNKTTKKAILKIQAAYSITRRRFIRFAITSFRDNDQGYSQKILQVVKKGDLLIRDLGYFVLKSFKDLNKEGVYFISRLWKGINVLSKKDGTVIDLAKMLKKRGQLDIEVFLGKQEQLPVRLIALPVEEKVANERRRKAKSNRDKRCSPNKEHLYLLGWELFITNVTKETLTTENIAELYFIRWRIETIFKSWKSYFRITDIPEDTNKIRIESYIYYMLIFITLFQVHFYNYCLSKTKSQTRGISLMRFIQYVTGNMILILQFNLGGTLQNEKFLLDQINYYCPYESRNDRVNFYQKILKLG